MKIKIMNYNILHGFHTYDHHFDLQRMILALDIVRKEDPGILILTEACYGDKNPLGIIVDYKDIFGYKYGFFASWGKGEWGNMILSKYPLRSRMRKLSAKTAIRSTIMIKRKKLHIDVIHPPPFVEEKVKVESIRPLFPVKKIPYILTGDFNAISDEDEYDQQTLREGFQSFVKKDGAAMADEFLKCEVIMFIKSQGLRDAFPRRKRHWTVPTDLLSKNKKSAMRVDFFFISDGIKVIDTRVIRNTKTEYASDHYPIVGVFEI